MRKIALLLFAAFLAAGETKIDLRELARGSPEAEEALVKAGPKILPELREALEGADENLKAKILDVIKEIQKREILKTLKFSIGLPKMALNVGLVNGAGFSFTARIVNRGNKEVVLSPFLRMEILDEQGNRLKPTQRIGRGGLRFKKCFLEDVKFERVAPGKRRELRTGIQRYMWDPQWITGFQVPGPGTYTIRMTYDFDRAKYKKRCKENHKHHDDAARPWNQALELT
ncbi:MAG: hypothetical protein O7E54_05690, partial [Planctomycetota bacterium]|nr:hypothetical protein [Planctomycetota bacterium]